MYQPIRQGQRYAALIIAMILAVFPIGGKAEAAETGARKMDGIREIYAASGFWGGSSFAVGKDGSVWVWGSNIAGQFGSGQSGAYGWTNAPHQIPGLAGVQKLAIGRSGFYFALVKDGSVMAWGGTGQCQTDNASGTEEHSRHYVRTGAWKGRHGVPAGSGAGG